MTLIFVLLIYDLSLATVHFRTTFEQICHVLKINHDIMLIIRSFGQVELESVLSFSLSDCLCDPVFYLGV